ncbi:MAG: hypothetical protein IPH51_19605 [Rubrivivax sp.]|nr:hypothetical protein [Rubrivivax sp.]
MSKLVHVTPHHTVILCEKDDLRRVYELCRKKYFDDYVLFWPLTHDAPRLPMAVRHGLRQLATSAGSTPSVADFAVQARRIAELEGRLAQYAAHGAKHVDAASRSLRQVGDGIGAALDSFSQRVSDGELAAMIVQDRRFPAGVRPSEEGEDRPRTAVGRRGCETGRAMGRCAAR